MSVLVCENLTKTHRNYESIRNFSFNFLENQIYAIVGKSDSSKEELLDLITTKTKPKEGAVFLDGQLLFNNSQFHNRLCYISRKTTFLNGMTIAKTFRLLSYFYPKWDNGLAYELTEYFKIPIKTVYTSLHISKQTILKGIIGLASRANITVFDNPLQYSDVKDRYDFFSFLYDHHQRYPRTIILTTDYIDEIDHIVDQILFVDRGRLFDTFTMEDLKSNFCYLSGKTEVLKSLISGIKVVGYEERGKTLTVCIRKKLKKDDIRKFQKYLIKISEVPIQKVFIYMIQLREKKGLQ